MVDNVWLVLPESKDLVSPYELYQTSKVIVAAQPFTVTMVNVVVAQDLDGFLRGKNDILILTRSSLGEQPFVERIHFYEEEIPKGKPINNLFADTVFVTDDYSGTDRLWLELNVLEIDTNNDERKAAISAFRSLAATAGAVFPVVASFAFASSSVASVVEKLFSAFAKDQDVVKVPLALHPGNPRPGKAPLQTGTFVVFSQPQDPAKYKLESNGQLTVNGQAPDVSYAVFNISADHQVSPNFVLSQRVATLLTQIDVGNPNSAKGTMEFLDDTLSEYSNFVKLKRYLELKRKTNLTDEEKSLMQQIAQNQELQPFLPKD
ncbi:MAG: hypothetical protein J2P31_00065 [Blastocatellia bacterium]|nr:hypothetical protein [Blastocatellia bacterium]